ncbi:Rhomboid protease AarA, partial [termite gut metagenome]
MMLPVTKNLLIINALLFFATYVAQKYGIDAINYLGLHFFLASDFKFFQLFTYMFMHGSFSHVFFNMFAVWMFGNLLERTWGSSRFLFYYIVCGLGAGFIQEMIQFVNYEWVLSKYTIVDTGSGIISLNEYLNFLNTVGASGAVYGILLAFGMLYPNEKMYIFPLPVPLKAKYFVIGYAVIELLLAII